MKLKKISRILSLALTMAVLMAVPVMASDVSENLESSVEIDKSDSSGEVILIPEESGRLGSITIKLEDTKKNLPKENVTISVIKVADVAGGEFVLSEEYSDTGIDLNNIQNANELEVVATKLKNVVITNKTEGKEIVTDKNGEGMISGLSVGVYLLYASDISGYENITPSLVSIPTWNETEGTMLYDIEVLPKHTPLPEPEVPSVLQTGISNHFYEYAVISFVCLASAGMVFVFFRNRKKEQ